jgi:tetratricopeptide (TPR) repeat protein
MQAYPDHPNHVGAGIALGKTLVRLGRHHEAVAVYREMLASAARVHGEHAEPTVETRSELADALYLDAAHAEALSLQQAVLAQRRSMSSERPKVVAALRQLARTHAKLRNHDEAVQLLREALALATEGPAPDRETTMMILAAMGGALFERGDFAAAAQSHRDALAISHERLGPDHPNTLTLTGNLAQSLRRLGQLAEAEPLFREVFSACRRIHGDADRRTKNAATELAILLLEAGKSTSATGTAGQKAIEGLLLEAHRLLVVARGNGHQRTRECAQALVELYAAWHASDPTPDLAAKLAKWTAEVRAVGATPGTGR